MSALCIPAALLGTLACLAMIPLRPAPEPQELTLGTASRTTVRAAFRAD